MGPPEANEPRDSDLAEWSRDLLESDRRYFEAGAEVIPVPHAVIAVLRGAESLASGCVVQRIDAAGAAADPEAWLGEIEDRLRALGSPRARLYLDSPHALLERALERRGYRSRVEHGLARAAGATAGGAEVEFLTAEDESGWSARREVMRRAGSGPDGHPTDPDKWVAMERRRHAAGFMRAYLIRRDGKVVGVIGAAPCGSLLRMKNLVIDPAHRRQGAATAAAVRFAALAEEGGLSAAGCFALDGEPGLAIYPSAGYRVVVRQIEWVRGLGGPETS